MARMMCVKTPWHMFIGTWLSPYTAANDVITFSGEVRKDDV